MPEQPLLPSKAWRFAGVGTVAGLFALLAALAVRGGTFFDDEILTLRLLRACPSPAAIVACANGGDVHPPLGYMLDALVHSWLGSWQAVKLTKGLAMALAAAWLAWTAGRAISRGAFALLVALLALDGTLAMWTTSLRWYGWFVPLYTVALAQVMWGRLAALPTLALLVGSGIVLFHTNYIAVIAVPLLGLAWWRRFGAGLAPRDGRLAFIIVGSGALACLPQAWVLASVHLPSGGSQTGSPVMALAQTALTIFPGNALFPLAPLAVLASAAVAVAAWSAWRRGVRLPPMLLVIIVLGAGAMVATGLGYRHRNSLFLHVTALPLLAAMLAALRPPVLRAAAIVAVLAVTAQGAVHAVRHEGTIKRSYNTPYRAVVATIADWGRSCPRLAVAHADPVLGELLGPTTVQTGPMASGAVTLGRGDCLIIETGNAADFWPRADIAAWRAAIAATPARVEVTARFGPEPGPARIARLVGRSIDDHAATLVRLRLDGPLTIPEFGASPGPAAAISR